MAHKNAALHMKTWRHKNREKYNQYVKLQMRKHREWKKIQLEFLSILL